MSDLSYGADGFPDDPRLTELANEINKVAPEYPASVHNTGGGIMAVEVQVPSHDCAMVVGFDNEDVVYDLKTLDEGEVLDGGKITGVNASTAAPQLAEAVVGFINTRTQG